MTRIFTNHKKTYQPFIEELSTYHNKNGLDEDELNDYLHFAMRIAFRDGKNDSEGLLVGLPTSN